MSHLFLPRKNVLFHTCYFVNLQRKKCPNMKNRLNEFSSNLREKKMTAKIIFTTFSMMQLNGNSFCVYVVFDSSKKGISDEANILDQIFTSKYVQSFIMMISILYNIIGKCIVVMCCISFNMHFRQSLLKF